MLPVVQSARSILIQYQRIELRLLTSTMTLGRAADCDVRVDDPGASRQHARLRARIDGVWIEDLGSKNGTLVNGVKVPREGQRLNPGDTFYVGSQRFVVLDASKRKESATATQSLGRAAQISEAEAEWAGRGSTTVTGDPGLTMLGAGRAVLRDATRPVEQRFTEAMRVVKDLVSSNAEQGAKDLLGEALDVLLAETPRRVLSSLVVATVRALVTRWSMQGSQPGVLSERLEQLQGWEAR